MSSASCRRPMLREATPSAVADAEPRIQFDGLEKPAERFVELAARRGLHRRGIQTHDVERRRREAVHRNICAESDLSSPSALRTSPTRLAAAGSTSSLLDARA